MFQFPKNDFGEVEIERIILKLIEYTYKNIFDEFSSLSNVLKFFSSVDISLAANEDGSDMNLSILLIIISLAVLSPMKQQFINTLRSISVAAQHSLMLSIEKIHEEFRNPRQESSKLILEGKIETLLKACDAKETENYNLRQKISSLEKV